MALTLPLIPAGMIAPTSGDAVINGLSIRDSMSAIRQSLGVCPQFDILWPDISVREHLQLYAAIKGFRRAEMAAVVGTAVKNVGARSAWGSAPLPECCACCEIGVECRVRLYRY